MISYSDIEQTAILQCFWQLLQAKPSKQDVDFIENQVTKGWSSKQSVIPGLEVETMAGSYSSPWVVCANTMTPYEAFAVVSAMNGEQKSMFKQLVLDIVYRDNGTWKNRAAMAVALFDATNVQYKIISETQAWLMGGRVLS